MTWKYAQKVGGDYLLVLKGRYLRSLHGRMLIDIIFHIKKLNCSTILRKNCLRYISMLEKGTGGQEMIAIAGRALIWVDDKMDFLLTDETLSAAERRKTYTFLTSACKLHAKLTKFLN